MQENHRTDGAPKTKKAYYVYDCVCTKDVKAQQILREYGTCAADRPDAQPNILSEHPFGADRPFGKDFAESQRKRAEEYFRNKPEPPADDEPEGETYTDRAGNEYIYRPGSVTGSGMYAGTAGAAAVRPRPLKLMIDQIVNMFETIDSRRKREEDAAKRQAIARKKFTENRHALFTAGILLLVTLLFTLFVYFAFFVISDVEVGGSELYTADEVVEAAGFAVGDNLYSFHAGRAEELILFHCPQLKSAQISRTVPNSVDIVLTDDQAVYYAEIYGETALLSAGLRVLGYADADTAAASGLTKVVLPAVQNSVAGRVLTFAEERSLRYVRNVLSAAQSSSLYSEGRIGTIDVSDEHSIRITCDRMYILEMGAEKDTDLKLRMAHRTIGGDSFDREIPAIINLTRFSENGEATVRYDMRLVVE